MFLRARRTIEDEQDAKVEEEFELEKEQSEPEFEQQWLTGIGKSGRNTLRTWREHEEPSDAEGTATKRKAEGDKEEEARRRNR